MAIMELINDALRFKDTVFYKESSDLQDRYDALSKLNSEYPNNDILKNEMYYIKKGLDGEKEIAYQLKKANVGMYVLHDVKIKYKDLTFNVKLMGFKHTGIFPEQSVNWDFMREKIKEEKKKSNREIKVLNLFAYTGCASVACLKEGASVVHVDSSRGMVDWAKENVKVNNLEDKPIRFLVDDCIKFVEREIRRGNKYDAIIMDPPSFGRGTNKEVWSIDKDLFNLVSLCKNLLVDEPLFFIINTYTAGLSKIVIENILKIVMSGFPGKISSYELGILGKDNLILPCGVCARYEK